MNAIVPPLQGDGHALGHAGRDIPRRQPTGDQLGRELLPGMGVEAVNQSLELLEVRRPFQAQPLGTLAAPLAAQLGAVEVIAAVGLAVIVLGALSTFLRTHPKHWKHLPGGSMAGG